MIVVPPFCYLSSRMHAGSAPGARGASRRRATSCVEEEECDCIPCVRSIPAERERRITAIPVRVIIMQ